MYILLSILPLIYLLSACSKVDAVPVSKDKIKCKAQIKPCKTIKNRIKIPSTYKTEVINYTTDCTYLDNFPVTVRKKSNYNNGDFR